MGKITRIEAMGVVLKELNTFEPALSTKELGTWITLLRYTLSQAETSLCAYVDEDEALHHIATIAALATACLEQYGPGQSHNAFGQVPIAEVKAS